MSSDAMSVRTWGPYCSEVRDLAAIVRADRSVVAVLLDGGFAKKHRVEDE